ncbi:MAG: serine/threonine protein kinase with repeat [Candidatus Aminicenantes bacterium]|nr:serine/threonine protein kinase with repeat [Candidatus Aminicenantes bacterium]
MLAPGEKVGHYEIIRLLGEGGMGKVFLARDLILDRKVALKFLPEEVEKDPHTRERFIFEAKAAAALDHPFICKVYETGEGAGKDYIAMEYVEGHTLKALLDKGPLPLRDALQTTLEAAEAIEYAHAHRIIHRDIKPANIMCTSQGHTKVMDFGLAKRVLPKGEAELSRTLTQASLTGQGAIAGTIAYMSPEQAKGDPVDGRSDIFSLGIVLYEMISGKHPFSKPSPIETLTSILRDQMPAPHIKPKALNPVLNPVLRKALAKNPDERYARIADFMADIRKAQREILGERRPLSRLWPFLGGAALMIILAVFAVIKFVKPRGTAAPQAEPKTVSVLIADVTNQTGDPMLDGVLEQLLGISLGSAENVSLFERKSAIALINRLDPKSEGRLSAENARLLCRRENINAIINASIAQDRGSYLIRAEAVDPVSGRTLAEADQSIKNKTDVLKAADLLSTKLRAGLGVIPAGSIEALVKETFTTASLEAMKEYADAQRMIAMGRTDEAIAAYLRAVDHDPNFGRAFAGLAAACYNKGDFNSAETYYKEALDRIDQMNEVEKHRTRGGYYLFKQNFKRAAEEYGALVERNPSDDLGRMNLALAYFFGHKMPEAYEEGLKAIAIAPDVFDNRYNQSWYALASGNFDRAREEAQKTLEMDPAYPKAFVVLALVELAQGRGEEAEKLYRKAEITDPSGASYSSTGIADLAVYQGRLEEAIAGLRKSIAADIDKKSAYLAADKTLITAQALLLQGKKEQAAEAAAEALRISNLEDVMFGAAMVYIEAGQEDKARNIAADLGRKVQDVHLAYAKLLGGYLSLKRGDTANALKLFDEAQALVDTWLGRLALGRAYLEAKAFPEAAAEFEKCEKRKGEAMSMFLNDLPTARYIDSLDYYVGRALEGQGKSEAARASYQKYLSIKAKADAGQAMVEDARRRLGSL